ncbi:MAG: mechanosensitive ion channel [Proteobacteria bacterium]|nr:mechanosensitive ion channel [Pseudomonadota bacterium]
MQGKKRDGSGAGYGFWNWGGVMRVHGRLFDRLILVVILVLAVQVGWTDFSFSASEKKVALTEPVTASNVDALLAGLSDEQVRQLFIEELKKEAKIVELSAPTGHGPVAFLGSFLGVVDSETDGAVARLLSLWRHIPQVVPELKKVLIPIFGTGGWLGEGVLLAILLVSYGVELVSRRFFCPKQFQADLTFLPDQAGLAKFWSAIANILPRVIGLVIFFCSGFVAFFLILGNADDQLRLLFFSCLIGLALVRSISLFSLLFCSPRIKTFRLLPLSDRAAQTLHRIMLGVATYIVFTLMSVVFLTKMQVSRDSIFCLLLMSATGLLLMTAIGVLLSRKKVAAYLLRSSDSDNGQSWTQARFASVWHILALLYLFVLWGFLLRDITDPTKQGNGAFLYSFFIVPIFMVMDKLAQWVVGNGMRTLGFSRADSVEEDEGLDEKVREERAREQLLTQKVGRVVRLGLFLAISIWLASLWGIQIPFVSRLAGAVFDILIVLTFALFFWKFISNYIERKIKESLPETDESSGEDDEWGSATAYGRSYTLLPMARKFIGSILLVMVTLIVFSSMGVDIGPLLAGAGVIGLAIGFGAQKMVSDIFSGFFYLMDDAFRVGEYLTSGSVSGMVESITLRNVMLRHHRGMLQIVPHSELGAITNYMRGGIVVKFNLDFPYDTDIDQVRKIIKKVGQAMLEDEEYGKDFILPLKSQGVRGITNSVMTIRAKFTARPGGQFVIQREAYRLITEALAAKGIHYAHKKVIVEIPPEILNRSKEAGAGQADAEHEQRKQVLEAVGAAAMAAVSADEEKANDKKEEKPGMPGM